MKPKELEDYVEYFLKVAIQKCGNLDEAQDLCQETMLAALNYLASRKEIRDIKAWLSSVMNRKFYDALRRKYKLPSISIDNAVMLVADNEIEAITDIGEAEELRKQIAFLSRIYREVIVRYYLHGESVEDISKALDIPTGTVKSRLSSSRTQIKKGFNGMENYTKNSYEPQILYVGISGEPGINGEPYNFTNNNIIGQNLLILAYDKPVTETELAKAIGIPTAYIESIIETLVSAELMKRVGNKVYTDFIIYSHDDADAKIKSQIGLIDDNFDLFWKPLQSGLDKLRTADFFVNLPKRKQRKLEFYFLMNTMSVCFFGVGSKIYDPKHDYPERPNGGKWVAMGNTHPMGKSSEDNGYRKYSWSGERTNEIHNRLGTRKIIFKVFDTELEKKRYYTVGSKNNHLFTLNDDGIAQMLYIINECINPCDTGIDLLLFENIPHFAECGVLYIENGKPIVDIPILSADEYAELRKITSEARDEFIPATLDLMKKHLHGTKIKLPPHLTNVPEQKQYLQSMSYLHMIVTLKAMENGLVLQDVDFPCPPMVLIVDK
ncbi:MAG: RNA polymerase sigma factor [Defluviitaleaceae bacterium]|nr:RNA polymerase sigma factor [Defluviitaleaceae bacterium]